MQSRRGAWATGLVLAVSMLVTPAAADTVEIGASRDTTLFSESGTLSNGAGQHVFAGRTDLGRERRALLAFDVAAAVPAGATITGVTLTLLLDRTRTQGLAVGLHRVTAAWGEASSDAVAEEGAGAAAVPGDATWTYRQYPVTPWTAAGGDHAAVASANVVVSKTLGAVSWSSAAMVADAQGWLDTPAQNHGWILVAAAVGNKETKRFASREGLDPTARPRLTVTFTTQTPSGACCGADGSCGVVTHPGTTCAGTYQGAQTSCVPNACPQPVGACCAPTPQATCTAVTAASCTASGGTFRGSGAACAMAACPVVLPPFVDPLPIPRAAVPVMGTAGGAATYQLDLVQLELRMHSALPPTTLWGFDDGAGASSPGPTIEARTGQPISMVWRNELREQGVYRTTHVLPVDACVMADAAPRTVIHLHGGHVPAASDGYPEATMLPGEQVTYAYPNAQPAATLWYHDHAMGITRLNVQMGLAGFYLVRDAAEGALGLPAGADEVPLVIQDRAFLPSGQLRYPAMWMPHVFGDTVLVNGVVWPYLQVRRGKYRFRVLDGSSSRTYTLALSNGATFHVIGTDGGLLPAPVARTQLTLMPGERADIVIDFAAYPAGTEIVLVNSAPAPYPGVPGEGVIPDVLKFVVTATAGHTAPVPAALAIVPALEPATAAVSRDLVLRKRADACTGEAWTIDGLGFGDITERPVLGSTEIWRFINQSGVGHPMHLHLVQFQVLDRQPFVMVGGVPMPTGALVPPPAHEAGWKDTVNVGPDEMVRVIARFEDYTGRFPYHCHILEHEDWDMMRQFEVTAPIGGDAGVDAGPGDAGPDDAAVPGDAAGTGGGGCCGASGAGGSLAEGALVLALMRRRRRPRGGR